jgi:type I restriction enzyme S subunit
MSFPRYPKYKSSDAKWLGELPEHWQVKRIGYYFNERREKVSDKDFPALSVTKNGIVPQLDTAAKSDDGDNRKKVCHGDFVINSRSDRKGSAGTSDLDGSVSLICTVLHPQEQVHTPFVHHLLRCQPFQEEFYRNGKGIVADLWSTNYSEMRNILLGMPPLPEQTHIAAFLDRETAKIDMLVAEQQRLIELLKEKRQAVISRAVTKGLNPEAPTEPSGIEWLGDLPAHWSVIKLGLISTFKGGAGFPDDYQGRTENEIPFFKVGDIVNSDESGVMRQANHSITRETAKALRAFIFPLGTIVFAKVGAALLLKRFRELGQPSCIDNNMMGMTAGKKAIADFLLYVLPLLDFTLIVNPGAVPSINEGQISNQRIALPPLEEQTTIVEYLNAETAKLDTLTAEAQRAIDLLQERRTALISAAVTGQIDVRPLLEKEAA